MSSRQAAWRRRRLRRGAQLEAAHGDLAEEVELRIEEGELGLGDDQDAELDPEVGDAHLLVGRRGHRVRLRLAPLVVLGGEAELRAGASSSSLTRGSTGHITPTCTARCSCANMNAGLGSQASGMLRMCPLATTTTR